ncbi:MAG: hypothetical protein WBV93_01005 [Anaerobacillus sp.]
MNDKTKSLLSQLPEVKDHRSKETIYQDIQKKMNEPTRSSRKRKKKTHWIIPTIAAAVVLLLAVLITPGLFNQNNEPSNVAITESDHSSQNSATSENPSISQDDSKSDITTDHPSKESAESSDKGTEEPPTLTEDEITLEHYTPAFQQSNGESIVLSFPDQQSLLLVPITFELDKSKPLTDSIHTILSTFDPSELGLANSPLANATFELVTDNGNKTLVANFPESGDSLSSTQSTAINGSVQKLAESLKAEHINWQTNGEDGYSLGNFGSADSTVNMNPSPYYLYETSTERRFLVEGPSLKGEEGAQLDAALSLMKEGDQNADWYQPSIPSDVAIYSFDGNGNDATIAFTENSKFHSKEEALQTIEAIMLVASQYNYQTIRFENTGYEQIGDYSLNSPLSVPKSPNAVKLN